MDFADDISADLSRKLAATFNAAGEELFLIGGAVRDGLLGLPHPDLDFATSSAPNRTADILTSLELGNPYRVGERFGTVGLRIGDRVIEVTTYRSAETYAPGSRKPEVTFGRTLAEDLTRRDFTVNALARDPQNGKLIDPLGGAVDLRDRVIRAVGEPAQRFSEDPLRLLRGVRFATRLDFTIEPSTWAAMQVCAPKLGSISRERVRDEYTRILTDPNAVRGLALLRDAGLLAVSVPQLLEVTHMPDHGPRHPLSLWDHTMGVVDRVAGEPLVRWAALLHDIAKPATRTHEPSGRPRFFHHEELGAEMAREILIGLRYPNGLVEDVVLLIATHMHLHSYSDEWSDGAVRRLMVRLGPSLPAAIDLGRADAAAHALGHPPPRSPKFDALEERVRLLGREPPEMLDSPLNGRDLMERYHRPPGPWIREIKDALRDEVLDGRIRPGDREAAWHAADALLAAR